MRVLVLSSLYPPFGIGGAELIAAAQAEYLLHQNHEVEVFAGRYVPRFGPGAKNPTDPRKLVQEVNGVPVYYVDVEDISPSTTISAGNLGAAKQLYSKTNFDVVWCHNVAGIGLDVPRYFKSVGAKLVVTLHDAWGMCHRNTLLKNEGELCEKSFECWDCQSTFEISDSQHVPIRLRNDAVRGFLDSADMLVCPGQDMASRYNRSGLFSTPVHTLPNAIDSARFPAKKRALANGEKLRFVWLGHVGFHKGIEHLLAALKLLASRITESKTQPADLATLDWTIEIYGDGDGSDAVEACAASLPENVRFIGRVASSEVPDVLARNHVLICSSIWPEVGPLTVMEALASGLACIAPHLGEPVHHIAPEMGGLLYEPGSAEQLANAMFSYLQDPSLVELHSRHNVEARSSFSWLSGMADCEKLLMRIGPNKSKPPSHSGYLLIVCIGKFADGSPGLGLFNNAVCPDLRFMQLENCLESDLEQAGAWLFLDSVVAKEELAIVRPSSVVIARADTELYELKDTATRYSTSDELGKVLFNLSRASQEEPISVVRSRKINSAPKNNSPVTSGSRVLLDLAMAHSSWGYQGVSQDAREIFYQLALSSDIDLTGLIRTITGAWHRPRPAKIGEQSKFLSGIPFRPYWLSRLAHALNPALGKSVEHYVTFLKADRHTVPMHDEFNEVIWRTYANMTVPARHRSLISDQQYRLWAFPRDSVAHAAIRKYKPVKLDTRGFDYALFQESQHVQVSPETQKVIRFHDGISVFASDTIAPTQDTIDYHVNSIQSCAEDSLFACVSDHARQELLTIAPKVGDRAVVIPSSVPSIARREVDAHTFSKLARSRISGRHIEAGTGVSEWYRHWSDGGKKKANLPPFILSVSTIEPRKNFPQLVKAFTRLEANNPDLRMVIVGRPGWGVDSQMEGMASLIGRRKLLHLENLEQEELSIVYSAAQCFVFPSFTEGFGMPPIEAMMCGCPVGLSDIPAHHFSSRDAALYFDPYDAEEIASTIEQLLKPAVAYSLVQSGYRNVRRFSREESMTKWRALLSSPQAVSAAEAVEGRGLSRQTG